VLAVDDQAPFLKLLGRLLRATDHLEEVGEADSGQLGVELARALEPDMVMLDVHMPGPDGIEAARRIKEASPSVLVVLVSTTHPDELPPEGQAIADAVLWKNELEPELLDNIWLRHKGQL
jgi:two-component system, NarL family, nitrate/nitrite response regulator NarL